MSRRSRAAAARAAQTRAGQAASTAPAPASPFASLTSLQREAREARAAAGAAGSVGRAPARGDVAARTPAASGGEAGDIGADDVALFLKANAGARPLRADGRLMLEHPRPAPVPRARTAFDDEPVRDSHRAPSDPLLAAYQDVTPLRGSGRVELDTPVRHRARSKDRDGEGRPSMTPANPAALPSDIDPDDQDALFRHAMLGAQPIDSRNRVQLERPAPSPTPVKRQADERAALNESLAAPLSFEDRLDMGDEAAFLRTGLPRRVLSDLRRGRWVLQGQIDLHGLTRDEAREALGHFLTASLQQGRRCIRVIHGKGLGSPGRVSILKQLSRGWLSQREEILAFCQAGPHDGGAGALLVLMRAQNAARD